jgi:ectoine hydroxylase-related dioxygenase (phytanoyl-CoA dioxygenase family)
MTGAPDGYAARIREALAGPGFLLLPEVFEAALVDAVREELDQALRAEAGRYGAAALAAIGQQGYIADVLAMGPATRELLATDQVYRCVSAALDDRAHLSIAQGISLGPGEGRGRWPRRWHADLFQQREAMPEPRFCFAVNCLVALDEMSPANGATCVVPGSQALVALRLQDDSAAEALGLTVTAPAGSVLLMDGGLWHAAGFNATSEPRRVLKLLFVRSWIRPQLDYRALIEAASYPDLTPRTAALLSAAAPGAAAWPGALESAAIAGPTA